MSDETSIVEGRFFRVWLFDRWENTRQWSYDGYEDVERDVHFDLKGAKFSDLTEQELTSLRVGLPHISTRGSQGYAFLVRDLRKQVAGTYEEAISEMISVGEKCILEAKREEERRQREADRRKLKSTASARAKKEAQLKKLQAELAALDTED